MKVCIVLLFLSQTVVALYCSYADLYNTDSCKATGDCCGFSYQCESLCCTKFSVCGTDGVDTCVITIGEQLVIDEKIEVENCASQITQNDKKIRTGERAVKISLLLIFSILVSCVIVLYGFGYLGFLKMSKLNRE